MSLVVKTIKKLDEYGIDVYNEYPTIDGDEYVIYIEDAILFVNEKEFSIGVSFQAVTKPETASTLTLIIKEIENVTIHVMESFIFNKENDFVCGDEAYNLIKNSEKMKVISEMTRNKIYSEILESAKCYEC